MPGSKGAVMSKKFIRLPQLQELIGLRRASIYNRINPNSCYYDSSFPKPFKLSLSPRGAIAWDSDEVMAWMNTRMNTR